MCTYVCVQGRQKLPRGGAANALMLGCIYSISNACEKNVLFFQLSKSCSFSYIEGHALTLGKVRGRKLWGLSPIAGVGSWLLPPDEADMLTQTNTGVQSLKFKACTKKTGMKMRWLQPHHF